MIDVQQVEVARVPAAVADAAAPAGRIDLLKPSAQDCSAPAGGGEVVVCGRRDEARYRLGPLPPLPEPDGLLSRPLRVRIAPGVSVGFLPGGGFGVRAAFGPGKKDGESDPPP